MSSIAPGIFLFSWENGAALMSFLELFWFWSGVVYLGEVKAFQLLKVAANNTHTAHVL